MLDQLEMCQPLSVNDWAGLREFSDEVVTLVQTATKFKFVAELEHHGYAVSLAKKLSDRLHTEFLSKMWHTDRGNKYTVKHLSKWLEHKTGPAGLILLEKSNQWKTGKNSS